jgi:hypothetical protein
MEMNVENYNVMSFLTQPSRIQIMMDKKQPEYLEYFNSLGSIVTNDANMNK